MVTLRLGEERERRLRRAASLSGRTVTDVVRDAVDRHLEEIEEGRDTLDVVLADFIGSVHGDGSAQARDAEDAFGRVLATKQAQGRL